MKSILFLTLLSLPILHCNTPKPITANPDNHTATSGTLGSAKMTNNLPEKSDTARIKSDSLRHR